MPHLRAAHDPSPQMVALARTAPTLAVPSMSRGTTTRRGYGSAHQRLRSAWAPRVATGTVPCARCGHAIPPGEPWDLGHDDTDRGRYTGPEHQACNRSTNRGGYIHFFPNGRAGDPLLVKKSLSPSGRDRYGEEEIEVRDGLEWDRDRLAAYRWLVPFLDVPGDASPPLFMAWPSGDAVGSYGSEAVRWIESEMRITLRWWQALAITRQLEHREDGSLVWHSVVESCPRRAGKSVRVRGMALWRLAHADMVGEVQTVVHCGNDLQICRDLQRGAWRWASERDWTVMRSNGKECIEAPDQSRWLVRSQDAVYGYDVCMGVVDEAWDVRPDTVSDGLEPAMLERIWAQLHLTSTAHRRATSLMRQRIRDALTVDDGETLLMLWAAGINSVDDAGDPEVWRAASPYWSEDRRRMIATKYAAALAGELDPQADDPDPMQGFLAQYLNVWQLRPAAAQRGEGIIDGEDWEALVAPVPAEAPHAAAVEAWFGDSVSLALAWQVDDQVVVSVHDLDDLGEVRGLLEATGFRRRVVVGASLLEDPALAKVRKRRGQGRAPGAAQDLRRLLADGVIRHDGGEHLTSQVLAARTLPGADGPRLVSTSPADAVKAAVWAVAGARRARSGRSRVIVAG